MKKALLALITGKAPRIKVAIASFLVGLTTMVVQRLGYQNGPEWSAAIATIATTLSGWILDGIAAKLADNGTKTVQGLLQAANYNVRADGDVGRVTIGTLVDVLREAGYSIPEPILPIAKKP